MKTIDEIKAFLLSYEFNPCEKLATSKKMKNSGAQNCGIYLTEDKNIIKCLDEHNSLDEIATIIFFVRKVPDIILKYYDITKNADKYYIEMQKADGDINHLINNILIPDIIKKIYTDKFDMLIRLLKILQIKDLKPVIIKEIKSIDLDNVTQLQTYVAHFTTLYENRLKSIQGKIDANMQKLYLRRERYKFNLPQDDKFDVINKNILINLIKKQKQYYIDIKYLFDNYELTNDEFNIIINNMTPIILPLLTYINDNTARINIELFEKTGYVNGDPHKGNIFVIAKNNITDVLIADNYTIIHGDLGLVDQNPNTMKQNLELYEQKYEKNKTENYDVDLSYIGSGIINEDDLNAIFPDNKNKDIRTLILSNKTYYFNQPIQINNEYKKQLENIANSYQKIN